METSPLLPDPRWLRLERVQISPVLITIIAATAPPTADCPACRQPATRVHSHYTRTLGDLPWQGRQVQLKVRVRRFCCDTPDCPKRIFVERMPDVAGCHARRTGRIQEALCSIGFALGGEAGSRLANRLGMSTSADTLLRLIRRTPELAAPTPRVLGVDDWAYRRGRRYGTILCDLERHCPVDLLEERSAEELANWLQGHPGIEIISRDRGGIYATGASAGAPGATQVADRWHLLHNLHESLVRTLDRHHRDLSEAASEAAMAVEALRQSEPPVQPVPESSAPPSPTITTCQRQSQASRARRMERYERVMELHRQGVSARAIGQRLGLYRSTVRRYVQAGQFPERADREYSSQLDPFMEYVRQRWDAGCRNAVQIARELKEQGFDGSYDIIRRRVATWRSPNSDDHSSSDPQHPSNNPRVRRPSPNRMAWLLTKDEEALESEEEALVEALYRRCPEIKTATDMIREYAMMLRERRAGDLEGWIARTHQAGVPKDLTSFADGLRSDWAAVQAAFTLEWSNGQVEGQINRLKLIKREMYGRASFDLLRQRVLHSG